MQYSPPHNPAFYTAVVDPGHTWTVQVPDGIPFWSLHLDNISSQVVTVKLNQNNNAVFSMLGDQIFSFSEREFDVTRVDITHDISGSATGVVTVMLSYQGQAPTTSFV